MYKIKAVPVTDKSNNAALKSLPEAVERLNEVIGLLNNLAAQVGAQHDRLHKAESVLAEAGLLDRKPPAA
jgi:hypothetical protein